jgi:transposase
MDGLSPGLNAETLIKFLQRLVKGSPRKVFLILDNLRVHHAKDVRAWLEKHAEQIEVFYLPSYSPELNPDERLNGDLKQAVTSRAPSRDKGHLEKVTRSHLHRLSKSPERVKSFFQHPSVKYAA